MNSKSKSNLDQPQFYINRELSWLEFNRRVLDMAGRDGIPLMERLKFLAIFSSNLDEFFMVRVAGLMRQAEAGLQAADSSGMTPAEQLERIRHISLELTARHTESMELLFALLRKQGLFILRRAEWNAEQRRFLREYFRCQLLPLLTPIAVTDTQTFPLLPSLQLHLGLSLQHTETESPQVLIVPVPTVLPRFIALAAKEGAYWVTIEDILVEFVDLIAQNKKIVSADIFRITRDADVKIQEDEAADLLEKIEMAVLERRRRQAVRIEISENCSIALKEWIIGQFSIEQQQLYPISILPDARCLWELAGREGFESLRWPDWHGQKPNDLVGFDSIWEAVNSHDVMLFHPYESFEPIVQWIQSAADDPNVLAIKQTLYRTSPDSPIIDALELAARRGKEVTVLVELKARFDEARNIRWARRLEDAGCYVIYGVAGFKTHAKALLIIRREEGRIKRYAHLSTGNYNDKTARLYSDIGLLTCDPQITLDVGAFFNLLTGFSESVGWSKLTIAPTSLRQRLLEFIEREIKASSPDRPGLIILKANSLEDSRICQALYRAAMAGVKVYLNIRGICCIRPGIKGVSDSIEVVSILGRYLEHARIYYFGNGGNSEVYLSSADMMGRNLDRRLELLFPIIQPNLKKRIYDILTVYFSDTSNAWRLRSDGSYEPVAPDEQPVRSQQQFYDQAAGIAVLQKAQFRFRPIRQNDKQ